MNGVPPIMNDPHRTGQGYRLTAQSARASGFARTDAPRGQMLALADLPSPRVTSAQIEIDRRCTRKHLHEPALFIEVLIGRGTDGEIHLKS